MLSRSETAAGRPDMSISTGVDAGSRSMLGLSIAISILSLFLAGWSFIASFDDDTELRRLQERLACLELPGANDCGVDGR
jgi:hypothetical protein